VVNLSASISGRYPNRGPSVLLGAGIPLLDIDDRSLMDTVREGDRAEIEGERLRISGALVGRGELQTAAVVAAKLRESEANLDQELQLFARNTLDHPSQELTSLLAPVHPPVTRTRIRDRHALVVVRGEDYKKDLQIIRGYLMDVRPVLIGVDGGADALLELGLKPDIIVGDMDNITDRALRCGAEIIVHGYMDDRESPGLKRVREMGLEHQVFAVPGTSEDAAMLLAYEGMASTMLVRMRIGSRLVDARGVSKLYPSRRPMVEMLLLLLVGLMVITVVVQQSEPAQAWLEMLGNTIRLKLLEWRILGR